MTKPLPKPGDIVLLDHPHIYDSYTIYRVFKTGKTMWEVERLQTHLDGTYEWEPPARRKVTRWFHAADQSPENVVALSAAIRSLDDRRRAAEKKLIEQFHADVQGLARWGEDWTTD